MRGKVDQLVFQGGQLGITPAYAGKSLRTVRRCRPPRDHPRVCGEKEVHRSGLWVLTGSPPRMRGKDGAVDWEVVQYGITPAYAGKRGAYD